MSSMSRVLISTGMLASICYASGSRMLQTQCYSDGFGKLYKLEQKHDNLVLCKLQNRLDGEFWYPGYEYKIAELEKEETPEEHRRYGQLTASPFSCLSGEHEVLRHVQTVEKVDTTMGEYDKADRCITLEPTNVTTINKSVLKPKGLLSLMNFSLHQEGRFYHYFDVQHFNYKANQGNGRYEDGVWCFEFDGKNRITRDIFAARDNTNQVLVKRDLRHSIPELRRLKLRVRLSEHAENHVVGEANSTPVAVEEDQKVQEEPLATPGLTPDGRVTVPVAMSTTDPWSDFRKKQRDLHNFLTEKTDSIEKGGGGFTTWQGERKYECAEGDSFLTWKKWNKKLGKWVVQNQFNKDNIDWTKHKQGMVISCNRETGKKRQFSVCTDNGKKKKTYVFRCANSTDRTDFARKLLAVIDSFPRETRRRLTSRPIKQLTQEISNRV